MRRAARKFVHHSYLAVTRGNAGDGLDFAGLRVVAETRPEDVIISHNSLQCGLDDFLRRGRNCVKQEAVAVQIVEHGREQVDIAFQANALSDFHQVFAPHTP